LNNDELLRRQLKILNRHLPAERVQLSELLKCERPRVRTKSGETHRFRKEELRYLAELVPKELHSKLRLPILIELTPQLGSGTAKISGNTECAVVGKILGIKRESEGELVLYRPEIRALRKKLQTTTQYALVAGLSV